MKARPAECGTIPGRKQIAQWPGIADRQLGNFIIDPCVTPSRWGDHGLTPSSITTAAAGGMAVDRADHGLVVRADGDEIVDTVEAGTGQLDRAVGVRIGLGRPGGDGGDGSPSDGVPAVGPDLFGDHGCPT